MHYSQGRWRCWWYWRHSTVMRSFVRHWQSSMMRLLRMTLRWWFRIQEWELSLHEDWSQSFWKWDGKFHSHFHHVNFIDLSHLALSIFVIMWLFHMLYVLSSQILETNNWEIANWTDLNKKNCFFVIFNICEDNAYVSKLCVVSRVNDVDKHAFNHQYLHQY